jgi:hypothetical protein
VRECSFWRVCTLSAVHHRRSRPPHPVGADTTRTKRDWQRIRGRRLGEACIKGVADATAGLSVATYWLRNGLPRTLRLGQSPARLRRHARRMFSVTSGASERHGDHCSGGTSAQREHGRDREQRGNDDVADGRSQWRATPPPWPASSVFRHPQMTACRRRLH